MKKEGIDVNAVGSQPPRKKREALSSFLTTLSDVSYETKPALEDYPGTCVFCSTPVETAYPTVPYQYCQNHRRSLETMAPAALVLYHQHFMLQKGQTVKQVNKQLKALCTEVGTFAKRKRYIALAPPPRPHDEPLRYKIASAVDKERLEQLLSSLPVEQVLVLEVIAQHQQHPRTFEDIRSFLSFSSRIWTVTRMHQVMATLLAEGHIEAV